MTRAMRIWHVEERFGYFYSTNQFGGFTRHATPDQAVAAIERDIADYGDEWRDNAISGSAQLQAFERAAREHLQHPPTEWTVERVDARQWHVIDHRGAVIVRRTTKKAAHAAIHDSTERRTWDQNCAWYRGEATDPRVRQLTVDEHAVVARILAEIDSIHCPGDQ